MSGLRLLSETRAVVFQAAGWEQMWGPEHELSPAAPQPMAGPGTQLPCSLSLSAAVAQGPLGHVPTCFK